MALVNYDIDFKKMVEQLLGSLLRKITRVAWLTAVLKPLRNLHDTFLSYTAGIVYDIKWNGQTIKLEQLLIDKFGPGIYITNNNRAGNAFMFGDGDDSTSYWGDDNDALSFFYDESSITVTSYNFTVNVPAAIVFVMSEMEACINDYKLFGTTYEIVII